MYQHQVRGGPDDMHDVAVLQHDPFRVARGPGSIDDGDKVLDKVRDTKNLPETDAFLIIGK